MNDGDDVTLDVAACTAVLLSVPQQVAERIESFLTANRIPCVIRRNTEMTPERLAEEYLRQSPEADRVLDLPLLGPLLRGRLGEDLKAEIKVVGSEIALFWDVLVRPEDLPEGDGPRETGSRGVREPKLNVPVSAAAAPAEVPDPEPAPAAEGGMSPVVLCELPWTQAWALTERLNAAGIPAAVLAAEEPDRERPMSARVVPVGVRPEDLDRARTIAT